MRLESDNKMLLAALREEMQKEDNQDGRSVERGME